MSVAIAIETDEDTEFRSGCAALAEHIGAEAAALPSWNTRLVRHGADWYLRVRHPQTDMTTAQYRQIAGGDAQVRGYVEAPWAACPSHQLFEVKVIEYPIERGVALLRSAGSPEIEVDRRLAVTRAYQARLVAEREAAAARAEEARKAAEARAKLGEELEQSKWNELSPIGQALYLVALAIEDGKTGADLVAELRRIGDETRTLNGTDAGTYTRRFSGHAFPWRPWR